MIEIGKEYIVDLSNVENLEENRYQQERQYLGRVVKVEGLLTAYLARVTIDGLNVAIFTDCLKKITKPSREIKDGDRVIITGNTNHSRNVVGDIGMVVGRKNGRGDLRVEVPGRTGATGCWTKPTEMELYEEQFVLPASWHVFVDESNVEVLSKWRLGNYYPKNKLRLDNLVGIYRDGSKSHNPKDSAYGFGELITFEQFRKYVLKEDITLDNKSITKEPEEINPEQGYSISQLYNGIKSIPWMEDKDAEEIFEGIKQYLQKIKIEEEIINH